MEKTNVMRLLDQKKIKYDAHEYEHSEECVVGSLVAKLLNEDPNKVFKTLVCVSKAKKYYTFMIPVEKELNLKKCAKAVNEKNVEMLPLKELLPLTGYVRGGCSPIGMKKNFMTVINNTALDYDTIIFSAGKIGYQVELNVKEIEKFVRVSYEDIVEE